MILQLKNGEANLQISEDSQLLLDGQGRLMGFYEGTKLIRRSYDNRWLIGSRPARGERQQRHTTHKKLEGDELDLAIHRARETLRQASSSGPRLQIVGSDEAQNSQGMDLLRSALKWQRADFEGDGKIFTDLVGRIPVLPPDRYRSLYVLISQGCRYNRCLFCELYRDRDFRNLDLSEVIQQIEGLRGFFGKAFRTRTSVFLGDASGLSQSQENLVAILNELRERLPSSTLRDGIHTFMDVFMTDPRPLQEMKELHQNGLKRIYIGLESAAPSVLSFYKKPNSMGVLRDEIFKAREAGISCALMVLAGGSGRRLQSEHIDHTVRFLNRLQLGKSDRIFLSPLVLPEGTGFRAEAKKHNLEILNPNEIEEEIRALRTGLSSCGAKVSHYELRNFLYR